MRACDADEEPEHGARWGDGAAPHQLPQSCSNLCKALSTGLVKHQYCTLTAEICFITGHYRRRSRLTVLSTPLLPLYLFQNSSECPYFAKGRAEDSSFTLRHSQFAMVTSGSSSATAQAELKLQRGGSDTKGGSFIIVKNRCLLFQGSAYLI